MTVIGVATAGLLAGIEMAAGVLLGAGVASLMRRTDRTTESSAERRGRVRRMLERRPHDLGDLRQRARAVMAAALGEFGAPPTKAQAASAPLESGVTV